MKRPILAAALSLVAALAPAAPRTQPNTVKFEVISVKVMSDEERKKVAGPDYIGATVLVRLRLSASSGDFSYYGFEFNKNPIGHRTVWSSDGKMLVYPTRGEARDASPGMADLPTLGMPTAWLHLAAGKKFEFEILDGTGDAGARHGTSAFVKFLPDETPVEIFSESYVTPTAPGAKP
jgi:hypothetical protein